MDKQQAHIKAEEILNHARVKSKRKWQIVTVLRYIFNSILVTSLVVKVVLLLRQKDISAGAFYTPQIIYSLILLLLFNSVPLMDKVYKIREERQKKKTKLLMKKHSE